MNKSPTMMCLAEKEKKERTHFTYLFRYIKMRESHFTAQSLHVLAEEISMEDF